MKKTQGADKQGKSKRDLATQLADAQGEVAKLEIRVKELQRENGRLLSGPKAGESAIPDETLQASRAINTDARITALQREVAEANDARGRTELERKKAVQQYRDLLLRVENVQKDFATKGQQLDEATKEFGRLREENKHLKKEHGVLIAQIKERVAKLEAANTENRRLKRVISEGRPTSLVGIRTPIPTVSQTASAQ